MASTSIPNMGVYVITNTLTGRVYVGSTNALSRRKRNHFDQAAKGLHHSRRFQKEWDKCGADAFTFEVVERVAIEDDLFDREQHWIDRYDAANPKIGLNISPIAGGIRGIVRTEEFKSKLRFARNWEKRTPEGMARSAEKRRGTHHTDETRAMMSANRSGRPQRSKRAMTFETAEEIRRLRLEGGLSQDALAARFGCSRKSIREILAGNTYTAP